MSLPHSDAKERLIYPQGPEVSKDGSMLFPGLGGYLYEPRTSMLDDLTRQTHQERVLTSVSGVYKFCLLHMLTTVANQRAQRAEAT